MIEIDPSVFQSEPVFRISPEKAYKHAISCGFLDKSGRTEDVTDERYDRLAMVYLLKGRGTYEDNTGLRVPLQAGDVFFRRPDRRHTNIIDPQSNWQECFVSLREKWFELFTEIGLLPPSLVRIYIGDKTDIPSAIRSFLRRLRTLDTPAENADIEFQIAALIRSTLTYALDNSDDTTRHKQLLQTAREAIRTHAGEDVSVEALLASQGLSYSRLRSLFRQAYGITPGEYRIRVRIERACALLNTTPLAVKEIASQLGYADAFSFSKQFKQRTGQSPLNFRRRLS